MQAPGANPNAIVIDLDRGLGKKDVPHEWPGIWNPAVAVLKKIEEGGSVYEGPVNPATGCKAGFGTLRYKDGSVYTGHFIEGLKHGQGMQRYRDGTVYDGMWENDLMHGEGLLTLQDQSKIKTTWVFGRKFGKGTVTTATGEQYNCVYYHDMENLLDRSTSRCWDCAWLNIFLSLCTIGSLFPAIYIEPRVFIVTGVCYIIILCETVCSLTKSFLDNVMPPGELEKYLV